MKGFRSTTPSFVPLSAGRSRRSRITRALLAAGLLACVSLTPAPAQAAPGDLDPTFSGDGRQTTEFGGLDSASGVALQPDGRIVVVGRSGGPLGDLGDFALARYNPDGSLDTTFSDDGRQTTDFAGNDTARGVALQPDGKVVVVGGSSQAGTVDFALARYQGDHPQPPPVARDSRAPAVRASRACSSRGFRARVRVDEPVRSVVVSLNGRRIRTTRRASFTVRVPARRLRRGRANRLTVVATDAAGNRSRRTFRLRACRAQRPPRFTG